MKTLYGVHFLQFTVNNVVCGEVHASLQREYSRKMKKMNLCIKRKRHLRIKSYLKTKLFGPNTESRSVLG